MMPVIAHMLIHDFEITDYTVFANSLNFCDDEFHGVLLVVVRNP